MRTHREGLCSLDGTLNGHLGIVSDSERYTAPGVRRSFVNCTVGCTFGAADQLRVCVHESTCE